jgi:putative flippase GtrA
MMSHSFVRFIIVGLLNTAVGLSTMYIFLHLCGWSYWVSTFTGNAIGACVSYSLNRAFTFKSNAPVGKSMFRFLTVILICYFLSYLIGKQLSYWVFSLIPGFPSGMATDAAILFGTGIYTITNYIGQKVFVFKEPVGESV